MKSLAIVVLTGCVTFATHANRSNDIYSRVALHVRQSGDRDLVTTLQQLGASKDYDDGTLALVRCIDDRAEVVRWQRQAETGDAMTKQSIIAQAASSDAVERDAAVFDANHFKRPEVALSDAILACTQTCGNIVATIPRDRQLASTYLGACRTSVAASAAAQQRALDRAQLVGVEQELAFARQQASRGCYIETARSLEHVDHTLATAPPGEHATALHDEAAAERGRHATEIARADVFNHDPRVVKLETDEARVIHRIDLAKDAQRAERDTSAAADLGRVDHDLEVERQDIDDKLAALARDAGVACPSR